jgi:hypothetical protein
LLNKNVEKFQLRLKTAASLFPFRFNTFSIADLNIPQIVSTMESGRYLTEVTIKRIKRGFIKGYWGLKGDLNAA